MADKIDLVIDQGTTFEVDFLVKDSSNNTLDVSTYTGTGKARKFISSNTAVTMTVNCFSNGIVRASLTANQTANMSYSDRYQYDVKLTSSSNTVIRIVEGFITISPQVSY
jgi:hypothetical protein